MQVLTFVSLLVVFLGWMVFTVLSTVFTTVPLDELPLEEMTERYNHPIKRRVPKIVRREVSDRRWYYAAAALLVAQVFSFYILWSYCISSKVCAARRHPAGGGGALSRPSLSRPSSTRARFRSSEYWSLSSLPRKRTDRRLCLCGACESRMFRAEGEVAWF